MSTTSSTVQTPELDFAQREKLVAGAINDISHIATLPEVTLKIVDLVENPHSTAQDLHVIISNDPALSARVLKVVNSAFYALPGQVGSINRAIVLLGLNAVKNIAIAASLAKLFRGGRLCPSFEARDLWDHSIGVAATTKMLSEHISVGQPDEAFLAGLIHDIGIMVQMQARRPKLVEVLDHVESRGQTFREAELKVFGFTHEDLGRALCEKWKFPQFLAQVAGFHHRPMELAAESRTPVCLIHVADILVARHGIGYTGTVDHKQDIDPRVLDELKLNRALLEDLSQQIPAAVQVAAHVLG